MMKKSIDTNKLYFGFPVFFLGYKDENFGYNITTSSSVFSLGSTVVMAMRSKSNAMKNIIKYKSFSLNIPHEHLVREIEIAGFNSHKDKFLLTGLSYQLGKKYDVPLVNECPISIECQIVDTINHGALTTVISKALNYCVDDLLLDNTGAFKNSELFSISYVGDDKNRHYRFFNDHAIKMGNYR